MSDVENAYKQIASFLNNETEKTLLICGIADEEKHRKLLKALNARGRSKGLIFLIHTTKDGMENFFRWAGLYKVKVPKKYGQSMQLSNLTIYFDNLSTKSSSNKYDNYAFDFGNTNKYHRISEIAITKYPFGGAESANSLQEPTQCAALVRIYRCNAVSRWHDLCQRRADARICPLCGHEYRVITIFQIFSRPVRRSIP